MQNVTMWEKKLDLRLFICILSTSTTKVSTEGANAEAKQIDSRIFVDSIFQGGSGGDFASIRGGRRNSTTAALHFLRFLFLLRFRLLLLLLAGDALVIFGVADGSASHRRSCGCCSGSSSSGRCVDGAAASGHRRSIRLYTATTTTTTSDIDARCSRRPQRLPRTLQCLFRPLSLGRTFRPSTTKKHEETQQKNERATS